MSRLFVCTVACVAFTFGGCNSSNADKIVGTWKAVKQGGKDLPQGEGNTIEFTKDGKVKSRGKEGTYKIDGDKITVTINDKTETNTIKTLTDDTLIILDERTSDGKKESFEIELKKQK